MACGVTKNGVVCDNAGTSSHTGPHSGVKNLWGYSLRVSWYNSDFTPVVLKRALVGVRARSDAAVIDPTGGAAQLTATGMNLNTRYTLTTGWVRPTGWVARSGFTGVEIENNSLLMNGSGNVRVHVNGDVTTTWGQVSKRLVKNGTVLQTWTNNTEGDHTFDVAVVTDDLLWLEFAQTGGFGTSYIENNVNTYIYTELI